MIRNTYSTINLFRSGPMTSDARLLGIIALNAPLNGGCTTLKATAAKRFERERERERQSSAASAQAHEQALLRQ